MKRARLESLSYVLCYKEQERGRAQTKDNFDTGCFPSCLVTPKQSIHGPQMKEKIE